MKRRSPAALAILLILLPCAFAMAHQPGYGSMRVAITVANPGVPWPPFAYLEPTPYGSAVTWHWDFSTHLPPRHHAIHRRYLEHMARQFGVSHCENLGCEGRGPAELEGRLEFTTRPPLFEIPSYESVLKRIEMDSSSVTSESAGVNAELLESLPPPIPHPPGFVQ